MPSSIGQDTVSTARRGNDGQRYSAKPKFGHRSPHNDPRPARSKHICLHAHASVPATAVSASRLCKRPALRAFSTARPPAHRRPVGCIRVAGAGAITPSRWSVRPASSSQLPSPSRQQMYCTLVQMHTTLRACQNRVSRQSGAGQEARFCCRVSESAKGPPAQSLIWTPARRTLAHARAMGACPSPPAGLLARHRRGTPASPASLLKRLPAGWPPRSR